MVPPVIETRREKRFSRSTISEQEQNAQPQDRYKGERKDYHKKIFKTPKETTEALLIAAENKANYGPTRLLVLAIFAGIWVGFGAHGGCLMAGGVIAFPDSSFIATQAQRAIFGVSIPIALVILIVTGSELYTGNSMTIVIGWLAGRVPFYRAIYNLGGVILGNFTGCVMIAYFISYGSGLFEADPWNSYVKGILVGKTSLSFLEIFTRGIGANAWVCAAVFLVTSAEDISGKILSAAGCIFIMAASGFEHVILNSYSLCIGLIIGSKDTGVSFWEVMYKNIIPSFLGNTCAGIFIAVVLYSMFLHCEQLVSKKTKGEHPNGIWIPAFRARMKNIASFCCATKQTDTSVELEPLPA